MTVTMRRADGTHITVSSSGDIRLLKRVTFRREHPVRWPTRWERGMNWGKVMG